MTIKAKSVDGYDLYSEEFRADPHAHYRAMRSGCPVAHSDKWGGSWMFAGYEDVRELARDAEQFTSRAIEVAGPLEAAGGLYLPPLTSDPPEHRAHRNVLMPYFMPSKVAEMEPAIRAQARRLVDELARKGHGDVIADFAQPLTLSVLTSILGVPSGGQFTDWMVRMIRVGPKDQKVRAEVVHEIINYIENLLQERERAGNTGSDLLSYLNRVEIDGRPLSRKHKIGAGFLIVIAGADTTWSAIGSTLWHLASHPADRQRLLDEPDLLDTAIEEFLRYYAPVTVGRLAKKDVEAYGRCIHAGERVILPFAAANRDPEVFEDPDELRIDRRRNRHITFGSGAHRCLGSNLARLELRVTLEEWLRAIPHFRLADGAEIEWTGGQTRGPESVPFVVEPAPAGS
ncbi:cytochrome P450 [Actinomadura sp. NBRC 104425]|uniref:cytochrome P450 n=1 Tax=Actinomadura sp. NBRC 104425 TaxID=3032204 RepID=UPI0024A243B3|nr:cytochrome P450 [Actinomadura sp. NBRC 104425]GLZ15794.1 cytochrome P450 [Actinomadura sp. NBRC 104425]